MGKLFFKNRLILTSFQEEENNNFFSYSVIHYKSVNFLKDQLILITVIDKASEITDLFKERIR